MPHFLHSKILEIGNKLKTCWHGVGGSFSATANIFIFDSVLRTVLFAVSSKRHHSPQSFTALYRFIVALLVITLLHKWLLGTSAPTHPQAHIYYIPLKEGCSTIQQKTTPRSRSCDRTGTPRLGHCLGHRSMDCTFFASFESRSRSFVAPVTGRAPPSQKSTCGSIVKRHTDISKLL